MSNTSQKPTDTAAKPVTTMSGHTDPICRIAYLPGGKRVISCSNDKTVRIWDVEKGEQEGTSMVHEGRVDLLAVTKDGKRVLSGGEDERITIWDVETHERIEEWAGHTRYRSIALSPDDRLAASGDWDGKIVIREMKSGNIKHSINAGDCLLSLCFSPNGEKLACAVHNVIQVYNVDSGKLVLGPIEGHKRSIHCVLWSLDGSKLFSASYDPHDTIRCWNSETGKLIGKPWTGHTSYATSLSLSPDGTKLVSTSYDQTIRYWDARSGEPIEQPPQHGGSISAVAFSPSGEFVACGDKKVSIWRVPWWDESQKQAHHLRPQLPEARRLIESSSPPPAQAAHFTPIPIATPEQRYPDTARNLNHIRSNFAHDLTGYVVRDGEEPIASGSFGDIYKGKLRLDESSIDVAVKAIRTYSADDGDDAQKIKKFRRELKTWANLEHVNILPLFGTTMNFGRFPAMVCPWLENGSLTSYLERRHDSLNPAERVSLVCDCFHRVQF
ncbi:WD40 repeat-like protein [Paxillus ammoniavirescens]|nr:WD40 repeat-like protein [Paxillus ammoniavirescens]